MPIRPKRQKKSCDLSELLCWVAHDDFDGPGMTAEETEVAIFGNTQNLEAIEIKQFKRAESEKAAHADILAALRDQELVGQGKFSDTNSSAIGPWTDHKWKSHQNYFTEIPPAFWSLNGVDWRDSSVKSRHGEYVDVHFRVADVLQIWPSDNTAEEIASAVPISASNPSEPSYSAFWKTLLVALSDHERTHGPGIYELDQIAKSAKLNFQRGWLRKAAYHFKDQGWINEAFTMGLGEDGGLGAELTGIGLETAETLASSLSSYSAPSKSPASKSTIPASDRIVSLDHNSNSYKEAVSSVNEVIDGLNKANDLGDLTVEEKEAITSSLTTSKLLLAQLKIRVSIVSELVVPPFKWVMKKFADQAIGKIAGIAVGKILALFGLS